MSQDEKENESPNSSRPTEARVRVQLIVEESRGVLEPRTETLPTTTLGIQTASQLTPGNFDYFHLETYQVNPDVEGETTDEDPSDICNYVPYWYKEEGLIHLGYFKFGKRLPESTPEREILSIGREEYIFISQ